MAGMSQTCNHVAAALFRVEAASRLGLNNPSCTSKPCEWLPNNKAIQPTKINDMDIGRSDFGKKGKRKASLNSSPKKNFNPISRSDYKLNLNDIATALKSVCEDDVCILFTALAKTQAHPANGAPQGTSVSPLDDQLANFETQDDILKYFGDLSRNDIIAVESATRGQSENPLWFSFRKHVITASKAHDIKTRFQTLKRGEILTEDLIPIFKRVEGKSGIKGDIPALGYGSAMEEESILLKKCTEDHTRMSESVNAGYAFAEKCHLLVVALTE